jgi:hypothetical protein
MTSPSWIGGRSGSVRGPLQRKPPRRETNSDTAPSGGTLCAKPGGSPHAEHQYEASSGAARARIELAVRSRHGAEFYSPAP